MGLFFFCTFAVLGTSSPTYPSTSLAGTEAPSSPGDGEPKVEYDYTVLVAVLVILKGRILNPLCYINELPPTTKEEAREKVNVITAKLMDPQVSEVAGRELFPDYEKFVVCIWKLPKLESLPYEALRVIVKDPSSHPRGDALAAHFEAAEAHGQSAFFDVRSRTFYSLIPTEKGVCVPGLHELITGITASSQYFFGDAADASRTLDEYAENSVLGSAVMSVTSLLYGDLNGFCRRGAASGGSLLRTAFGGGLFPHIPGVDVLAATGSALDDLVRWDTETAGKRFTHQLPTRTVTGSVCWYLAAGSKEKRAEALACLGSSGTKFGIESAAVALGLGGGAAVSGLTAKPLMVALGNSLVSGTAGASVTAISQCVEGEEFDPAKIIANGFIGAVKGGIIGYAETVGHDSSGGGGHHPPHHPPHHSFLPDTGSIHDVGIDFIHDAGNHLPSGLSNLESAPAPSKTDSAREPRHESIVL